MNKSKLILVLILFLFAFLTASCSSVDTKKQKQLRELFFDSKYEEANKTVAELIPLSEERSKLLYFLEKGLILHAQGKYFSSNAHFNAANDISQRLFTKSISKSAQSMLTNDTYDNYYGAFYERSLIHFYLTLNNFLIYQNGEIEEHLYEEEAPPSLVANTSTPKGELSKVIPKKILSAKEKREYLNRARAQILAWDSLLSSWRDGREGKSVFKNDMLAKVFGSFVHESYQTPSDLQIANQLLKDAKDLMLKNYNAYPTFNRNFVKFKKDFDALPSMDVEKVRSDYVLATDFQKELVDFLEQNISKTKESKEATVAIILQLGMIPEKISKKYNFGLEGAVGGIEDPEKRKMAMSIGSTALGYFAANILGLVPKDGDWLSPGATIGVEVGKLAATHIGFSFELPKVINTPTNKRACVEIYDKSKGTIVKTSTLPILNPLGDIAEEAVDEDSAIRYVKTGVRMGSKHLLAILSAYGTYKMISSKSSSDFIARNAAVLQYIALSKGIALTERADVRYWITLPKDIRMTKISLAKGCYGVRVKIADGQLPCDLNSVNTNINTSNKIAGVNYYQFEDINIASGVDEFKVINLRIKKL
ncbi:MAG: hypothetical protein HQK51_16665 [Oligoflexia bacterium]|nr:hypothetical protein [Oligoflexia bacterium]